MRGPVRRMLDLLQRRRLATQGMGMDQHTVRRGLGLAFGHQWLADHQLFGEVATGMRRKPHRDRIVQQHAMHLPVRTMQQSGDGAAVLGHFRLGRFAGWLGFGLGMRPMRAFIEDALATFRIDRQRHQHLHVARLEATHGERAARLERLQQRLGQMRRGVHLGAVGE